MTKSLILALSADPGGPITWGLGTDGDAARVEATGRLAGPDALTDLPLDQADRVIAVVPGSEVLARDVALPSRRESEARTALPYLLEDDLATDPDRLHFALGAAGEDGVRRVAVVSQEAMDGWRSVLEPLQGKAFSLIPDFEALRPPADGHRVVDLGDRVVVVSADGTGFTTDADLASFVLNDLTVDQQPVHLETNDVARVSPQDGWGQKMLSTRPALTDGAFFSEALGSAAIGRFTDLMQGKFARAGSWSLSSDLWRRVAILAGLAVLAYAISLVGQGWRYHQMADDMNARALATFQSAFPEVRRVVNPQAQMASKLADLKTGTSDHYLRLSGLLFGGMESVPAIEIRDLRFQAERETLSASIAYADYADIERLRTAITQRGGTFEEGGSRQMDGRIVGDITIGMR